MTVATPPVAGRGRRRWSRRDVLLAGAGVMGVAGLAGSGTAAYAVGVEPVDLTVTKYRLSPPGWPAGRKLTIAVVADLHAGGPNMGVAQIRSVVDQTNALGADVIAVLGDYFATHRFITEPVPHPVWAAELARLAAPLGVFAILGNHDWWHDVDGVRAALAAERIRLLENDAVLIGSGRERVWIAGIADQIAIRLGPRRYRGMDDLPGTLAKVTTPDPVVLLVHEPDIFPKVPDRVALTLAGHTHGGQIRIPLLWEHFVPSIYGARYAYGHIVETNRHMIVSGGLGTSWVPARLGVPPEVVLVELSS